MAVGLAEDESGNRFVLIGTSERARGLRSGITLNPGEILVRGFGHAEADIINFARQSDLNLLEIGATRPICNSCAVLIEKVGATPVTRLKVP
jgi:filamentous hemagglutinin